MIAKESNGNLMSAITDLETFEKFGKLLGHNRNLEEDIFSTLNRIFSGKAEFFDDLVSSDQDAKILEAWIAENIPRGLKGSKLIEAMEILSFTDILIRKINAQNWYLLKYIYGLILGGISSLFDREIKIKYNTPNWKNYLKIIN